MLSLPPSSQPIEIFYSHISQDKKWQEKLEMQFAVLKQHRLVTHWHHGLIPVGAEKQQEIDKHLNTAQVFLLLVSPGFLASSYHSDVEVKRALEKYEKNEAHVIPVILGHCDWKTSPFSKLQALPRDGNPMSQSDPSDSPLSEVAEEIRKILEKLIAKEWLNYGRAISGISCYEKALEAFKTVLEYDERHVEAYNRIGDTYYAQHNDENDKKALDAYESARKYDPRSTWAWYGIGNVYLRQKNYERALDAYLQVTTIDPDNEWSVRTWYEQGKIHRRFNRLAEALTAYERAITASNKTSDLARFHREKAAVYEKLEKFAEELVEAEQALALDPDHISSYRDKAHALNKLGRPEEALAVCEEAIRRKPDYPNIHQAKGVALKWLGKYQEALEEFEEAIRLKSDYMWAWKQKEWTLKLLAQQARGDAERYDQLAQEAAEKAKQFGY